MLKVEGISALKQCREGEPINGMDAESYGPRLYANFKPTKPPGDPLSLMHMLKKSMHQTTSTISATNSDNQRNCATTTPHSAYMPKVLVESKSPASAISPMRTEYAAQTWKTD